MKKQFKKKTIKHKIKEQEGETITRNAVTLKTMTNSKRGQTQNGSTTLFNNNQPISSSHQTIQTHFSNNKKKHFFQHTEFKVQTEAN
jgi:hypothetical protein